MKKIFNTLALSSIILVGFTGIANAQLTDVPDGGNKKATVGELIGITDVTIHYNRPAVKKRDGHIFGELVPVGYVDQGFGTSKAAPWRAGANESTNIEFSTDVTINGQPLAAGKYGFFIAYDPNESTIIFSKNSDAWGSFFYKPEEDVLRVKIKPITTDRSVERLRYEFVDQTPNSAVVQLEWEKMAFPFKVEVDLVKTELASIRKELVTDKGFMWESWDQAAQFCLKNKINLDEALTWADNAVGPHFGGGQSFQAWSTKAEVLNALGRNAEADAIIKKSLPFGDVNELNSYGRSLIADKKTKEALEVFKLNYSKHPNEYAANSGMAHGYSATGEYKKALPFAERAVTLATNPPRKAAAEEALKTLQAGKDIN